MKVVLFSLMSRLPVIPSEHLLAALIEEGLTKEGVMSAPPLADDQIPSQLGMPRFEVPVDLAKPAHLPRMREAASGGEKLDACRAVWSGANIEPGDVVLFVSSRDDVGPSMSSLIWMTQTAPCMVFIAEAVLLDTSPDSPQDRLGRIAWLQRPATFGRPSLTKAPSAEPKVTLDDFLHGSEVVEDAVADDGSIPFSRGNAKIINGEDAAEEKAKRKRSALGEWEDIILEALPQLGGIMQHLIGIKPRTLSSSPESPSEGTGTVTIGQKDAYKLISKSFNEAEGWMNSTEAMNAPGGALVRMFAQHRDNISEVGVFVPGAAVVRAANGDGWLSYYCLVGAENKEDYLREMEDFHGELPPPITPTEADGETDEKIKGAS